MRRKKSPQQSFDSNSTSKPISNPYSKRGQLKKPAIVIPRNQRQEDLLNYCMDDDIKLVATIGPAGCGKSFIFMTQAIQALQKKKIDKIVILRPLYGVENGAASLGALPGTLFQKLENYMIPLLDFLEDYYPRKEVMTMIENDVISVQAITFLRGRNLDRCWIVADEMQNCSIGEVKCLLTRACEGAKIFISGDLEQIDGKFNNNDNGLADLIDKIEDHPSPMTAFVEFEKGDSVRSPFVQHILDLYQ